MLLNLASLCVGDDNPRLIYFRSTPKVTGHLVRLNVYLRCGARQKGTNELDPRR